MKDTIIRLSSEQDPAVSTGSEVIGRNENDVEFENKVASWDGLSSGDEQLTWEERSSRDAQTSQANGETTPSPGATRAFARNLRRARGKNRLFSIRDRAIEVSSSLAENEPRRDGSEPTEKGGPLRLE